IHSLLGRGRAPLPVRAFELILVTQILARVEINRKEINLQIILIVSELKIRNLRAAQLSHRTALAGDAQTAESNRRRRMHALRLRDKTGEACLRAEPERPAAIAESRGDEVARESIRD